MAERAVAHVEVKVGEGEVIQRSLAGVLLDMRADQRGTYLENRSNRKVSHVD